MTEPRDAGGRLDSWKIIAAHLGRDERTVRRWERELGLPVHRLPGGRGRSVYAYTSEIDEWLKTAESGAATAAPPPTTSPGLEAGTVRRPRWLVPSVAIVIAAGAVAAWALPRRVSPGDVSVRATAEGVVATDLAGAERWRYPFSPEYRWLLGGLDRIDPAIVLGGSHPGVLVATAFRQRRSDSETESGALFRLDLRGALQETLSFRDTVTIHGSTLGPPWAITSFAVRDSGGGQRIAVVAHHYVWNASIVTVLDEQLRRQATFAHDGWIEAVRWVGPGRLLVAGFSNPHDGGMVAIIDPAKGGEAKGEGAKGEGAKGEGRLMNAAGEDCDLCPTAALVRMVILPRTELNHATASPFNRALISLAGDRVTVRTAEVPIAGGGFVDAIYEFTPALDLVQATYSDAYRERIAALVGQAKLSVRGAARGAPPGIEQWTPEGGWRKLATVRAR